MLGDAMHLPPGEGATEARTWTSWRTWSTPFRGGNAFFARQFASSSADAETLVFDALRLRWVWDTPTVTKMLMDESVALTDEVATLLSKRIQNLPAGSLGLLRVASCLGSRVQTSLIGSRGSIVFFCGQGRSRWRAIVSPRRLIRVSTSLPIWGRPSGGR